MVKSETTLKGNLLVDVRGENILEFFDLSFELRGQDVKTSCEKMYDTNHSNELRRTRLRFRAAAHSA